MRNANYTINNQEIIISLRDEADQSVAAEIFKLREYRIAEPIIISATLPILDVGAHAGFFSIYARALNAIAPIIAIEPEPHNLQAWVTNTKQNKVDNITLVKGALTKERGLRELIRSQDSHNHVLKTKETEKGSISVQGYDFKHFTKLAPQGFSLVKMDIEGGEYEVFENLSPEDFSLIHALVMEYHDLPGKKHQIIEQILREHGFGVQTFPSKFDKTMGFFWATNKRCP